MNKKILLSFDIEEFDIPEEYGIKVNDKEKFMVSLEGFNRILKLLDKINIKATFFTTANFALNNPEIIREASKKHEIGSHSFFHSSFEEKDLKNSKVALEKIINKKVSGFRMPRLVGLDENKIKKRDIVIILL